ncbi:MULTISPECIES: SCO family protein [unclassified Halomonas]|uniref:SCO family protein n=1 Tax=unclassified Halomonas TaxID=2609666 RepID=UPI0006DB6DAF|nr:MULTISPECIES: SCO family protein [unclassified Halomonas]KPQ31098.1 MAG: protein SCO1/2 [Halomonas sp. HL-93]SBR45026.1 protein SCO1/2 [Halomonas sp. HL-93]SNY97747.1 protein SCO1/2 [Halomonas sp. hl-4]
MAFPKLWLGVGAAALVVASGVALYKATLSPQSDIPPGGEIELPSTQGDFSLSQLADDQVALVSFGYTYCPDVCPMTQSVKRQALAELSTSQREQVVPVMVTVDPERDTLERLEEYLAFFGEDFIGARGNQSELDDVMSRYGVITRRVEAPDSAIEYTIDHSSSLYLVNRDGDVLQRVLYSPTPQGLSAALEQALDG